MHRHLLLLDLLIIAFAGCGHDNPEKEAKSCVHLVAHSGEQYSLTYYGEVCPHSSFVPLPSAIYDNVFSWASDVGHYKIMPELDRYRIIARLATRDERHRSGFSLHSGFWSDYQWTHFANQAYLGLRGRADTSRVRECLEEPLVDAHLLKPGAYFGYEFREVNLATARRLQLASVFARVELVFSSDSVLTSHQKTIDEVAGEVAEKMYQIARKYHFTEYTLIR